MARGSNSGRAALNVAGEGRHADSAVTKAPSACKGHPTATI